MGRGTEISTSPTQLEEERIVTEASNSDLEDTIAEDGILCSIISSLPLREAVGTCVLSRRWKNMWKYLPNLKFDVANILDASTARLIFFEDSPLTRKEKFELLSGKRAQFIRSVDSVLQHHQGRVDEFLVRYFIPKIHSNHLDSWVQFAVASKTKQFDFQLHKPFFKDVETDPYEFPFQLLASSSIVKLSLSCCSVKPPHKFDGFGHLKELRLFYIDVTEEDIDHILSNCSVLECLTMWNAPRLVTLTIPRHLSQFQLLIVKDCPKLKAIKVNATNFSTLRYSGAPVDFKICQSSQLKDAKIYLKAGPGQNNPELCLNKLSSSLPHLESLLLSGVSEVSGLPKGSNSFTHLTCLEWEWNARVRMSPLLLSTLLDATPFLKKLKLLFLDRVLEQPVPGLCQMVPKHPRSHLKSIEISGFYFDQWQLEIALYLLNNATELEMMTIKVPSKPSTEIYETYIKNLRQEVPVNVKLMVLYYS